MAGASGPLRIVVGIDFGTTFSGTAEAYSGASPKADDINVIKSWPGIDSLSSDKVPSEIAYISPFESNGAAGDSTGTSTWSFLLGIDTPGAASSQSSATSTSTTNESQATVKWGSLLSHEDTRLRCIKLLLDPNQEMPPFVSESDMRRQLGRSGKDATTVVADYLREIYRHTMEELANTYGQMFMKTTKLQFVLTVPAVWSDGAKNATLVAAQRAGIGPDLITISEPEAAAIYTLQAVPYLKKADNFILVDCGGGTVDLISYGIQRVNPLCIEESVPGSGACCGSAMLNMKFEEFVSSKLGAARFATLCNKKPQAWSIALKYFDTYVKPNFGPETPPTKQFFVPLGGVADDAAAGIEDGYFALPATAVAAMFRPILDKIVELVDGQIIELSKKNKTVAGIVLVGGFGQSKCLLRYLNHRYVDQGGRSIRTGPYRVVLGSPQRPFQILRPKNPWTAVVRGAVLRGLEGADMVISRKSRRHYGLVVSQEFAPSVHPKECKYWDDNDGTWRARNRMKWYVGKGTTVCSEAPLIFYFYRDFALGASKTVTEDLVACDANIAPGGYSSAPGSTTRVLCKTPINLEKVPAHLFESCTSLSGRKYLRLNYEIGMRIESGGLRFDLRVDGVVYGQITATFD